MSDKIIHLTDDSFDTDVLKADGAILVDFWQSGAVRAK
ncbi:thioredoxin [Escherichia coli]|uniref:Thioredoxin n=1 Tax=Escherichia coli TaxID=562 RepID=A0A377BT99_ECOLX|nr:thioredoxin [Escherichia coli]STJ31982.1 thioredoxin [Escherichia coli]STL74854.1 thioredoxin [Escherichia coli]